MLRSDSKQPGESVESVLKTGEFRSLFVRLCLFVRTRFGVLKASARGHQVQLRGLSWTCDVTKGDQETIIMIECRLDKPAITCTIESALSWQ